MNLTVALNVHSETVVCGPTLKSAEAAIAHAEAEGWTVERVIGLDRPTAATEAYFAAPELCQWRREIIDCGDLGLARNALVDRSEGDLIAFLDADDLFGENWLSEVCRTRKMDVSQGKKRVYHPEINWFFDGAESVLVNPDPSSEFYAPLYWRIGNYYDSLVAGPREAFEDAAYRARDKDNGFGFEDWQWNIDVMRAGWDHAVLPDTIIFKRRRDESLVVELGATGSVLFNNEDLAVDRIHSLGRVPQPMDA